MTENEAKVKLERTSVLWNNAKLTEIVEAVKVAIQAIERVQKFEAIGTIKEFKALKEKNTPKKPIPNKPLKEGAYVKWTCPNCGKMCWCGFYYPPLTFDKVCTDCLQAVDWQYSEDDKAIKDIIELASETIDEIAEEMRGAE